MRQLEHVLLNAWVLSDEAVLEPADFDVPDGRSFDPRPAAPPDDDEEEEMDRQPRPAFANPRAVAARSNLETLSRHRRDEKERILQALQACNWNRVAAAKLSGIPRRTLYRRLREYGIQ